MTVFASPTEVLLIYFVIALVLNFIVVCIYRLTFHPLAKYPGPLRYKLSAWPLLWQAYKGNRHVFHLRDHERYGPIVRIAPNTLSFNTETALNTIYGSIKVNVKKGEWYKTFDIAAGAYSSFTETDKEKHAAKRRWLSPAFSDMLNVAEPRVMKHVRRYCDVIFKANDWSEKRNMAVDATYLGFDIMGDLSYGCDFRTVDQDEYRDLANSVVSSQTFLYWVSYLPVAWLVRRFLRSNLLEHVAGKGLEDNNRLINYVAREVDDRMKQKYDDRKDFLHLLINVKDRKTGWQPSRADLDVEGLNLINAGADPYSAVLAATFFYLLHNEHALRKLVAEVREAFASPDEICSGTQLNSCTYLYACIEETLRRAAPVPSHLPRDVLPGGIDVDGHHVPAGMVVGVAEYAIYHNAKYFPDPFSFRPERWIESAEVSRESIALAKRAFAPFGLGIRGCIGKNIAYLQLKLTLAYILYVYDIRLAPDDPGRGGGHVDLEEGRRRVDEYQMYDSLGFARDGPMMQFRPTATS